MPIVYTTNADRDKRGLKALQSQFRKVVAIDETYTAASLASGSTINVCKPPPGYRFAGFGLLTWADLSGTNTYTVSVGLGVQADGTIADVDSLLPATSVADSADWAQFDPGDIAKTMFGFEFDGETWITLTTAGAATDATGVLRLVMYFMAA